MSNRSYLYAGDGDPTLYDIALRGVCEHVADVSMLQLIMVARGARAVASKLFDDRLAVLADSRGAAERAFAFVDKLAEGEVSEPEDFAAAARQMREVLGATPLGRHLLLEVAEVLDTDESVLEMVRGLVDLDAQVERALAGQEEAWLAELRATWQDSVMPWWAHTLYYNFEQPSLAWNRRDVEAMLIAHDAKMSSRVGHPFHYRLAADLEQHQLRIVIGMLPLLARELETVADNRLWSCEIGVHDTNQFTAAFEDKTLFVASGPKGWPSQGPRRRIMDALGIGPPPMRVEYGRATV